MKTPFTRRIFLLAAFFLAAIVRLVGINGQGFWHDEIYTRSFLSGYDIYLFDGSDLRPTEAAKPAGYFHERLRDDKFWENYSRDLRHEGHPPLYLLLLRAWSRIGGTSETSLWLFSIFCAAVTVWPVYQVAVAVDDVATAQVATALFAISPFSVYFSLEARSYSLAILLIAMALYIGIACARSAATTAHVGYAAAATACLYTHYYTAIAVGLIGLWIVVRRRSNRLVKAAVAAAAPFVIFVPWVLELHAQSRTYQGTHWTEGAFDLLPALTTAPNTIGVLLLGPTNESARWERVFATGVLLAAAVGIATRRERTQSLLPLLLFFPAYWVGEYFIDLLTDHHTIIVPRYAFSGFVPLLIVIVAGLRRLSAPGKLILAALFTASSLLTIQTLVGHRAPKQMLREAAALIGTSDPATPIVVSPSGPTLVGLAHYSRPNRIFAAVPPGDVVSTARSLLERHPRVLLALQQLGVASLEASVADVSRELGSSVTSATRFVGIDILEVERR